jgi:hypothetical protein
LRYRVHRHDTHARGRKFEGERDAVEVRAYPAHRSHVRLGQLERRMCHDRAVDEQPDCLVVGKGVRRHRLADVGDRKRRQREDRLAGHVQRFPARGQHLDAWTCLQQLLRHPGAGLLEMLAVVQHHQHAAAAYVFHHRFEDRRPGLLDESEDRRHGLRHESRIGQRRQLHEPDAVLEVGQQSFGELERQSCLAQTADPGKGQQTGRPQRMGAPCEVAFVPDIARQRARQVVPVSRGGRGSYIGRGDLHRKAVAVPGHGLDRSVGEDAAQSRNLHRQIAFLDYQIRPNELEQLFLSHELAGALDQHPQQVERPAR